MAFQSGSPVVFHFGKVQRRDGFHCLSGSLIAISASLPSRASCLRVCSLSLLLVRGAIQQFCIVDVSVLIATGFLGKVLLKGGGEIDSGLVG